MRDNNIEAFFALVRAGLFPVHGEGFKVNESIFQDVEWKKIYQLAQEQSVLGLVLQGIETVQGSWLKVHGSPLVPKVLLLQWIGEVQMVEQRNKEMNAFIAELIEKLRKEDIYAILVKGQGIAQCYERPLWRSSGDVDFFLSKDDYKKAIDFLTPIANKVVDNTIETKHFSMFLGQWEVELHGTLHSQISKRIDSVVDKIQEDTFNNREVRTWYIGNTDILLPSPNNDIIFVFTHILQHFFLGGIGLRQLCDIARLLWTYRECIDNDLLNERLLKMGIMKEWKTFGNLIVSVLGLPSEAMPFYEDSFSSKTQRVLSYILDMGNFGHNKDVSFQYNDHVIIRKMKTFWRQVEESFRLMCIFPKNSIVSLGNYWVYGTKRLSKL